MRRNDFLLWVIKFQHIYKSPWISSSGLVWLNKLVKLCFSSPEITHLFRQYRPPTEDFLSNADNSATSLPRDAYFFPSTECTVLCCCSSLSYIGALLRKSSVGWRNCLNKWVIFGLEKHNFTNLYIYEKLLSLPRLLSSFRFIQPNLNRKSWQ